MGNKLTCDCNSHVSNSSQHQQRIYRFWAEVFRLSPDGQKWEILRPSLLLVSVAQAMNCLSTTMTATTAFNEVVFSTTINPESCVRRHSDCFVYWKSSQTTRSEMFALNVVSAIDADTFCQMTSIPQPSTSGQIQVEVSNEVAFEGDALVALERPEWNDCIANLAVNELRIHKGIDPNDVYALKLRQCQCYMEENGALLYLVSDANVFVARCSEPRLLREFFDRVLRNSTLRIMNTSNVDTARRRIQVMLMEHNKQLKQLLSDAENIRNRAIQAQLNVLTIRNFFLETRLASLTNSPTPSPNSLFRRIHADTLRLLPAEKRLSALFLLYAHKITSLGSNAETATNQILCASQLGAADEQMPSCSSSCRGSAVEEDTSHRKTTQIPPEPSGISTRRRAVVADYELEKSGARLGLTICAHLQDGRMVAEVTGKQEEASEACVGDEVVAVDGTPIAGLQNASEAENLLRKGRILKMKRTQSREEPGKPCEALPPRPSLTNSIREEKLQKSICELVETEKAFVSDLDKLVRQYARVAQLPILESAEKLFRVQQTFLEGLVDAAGDLATGNGAIGVVSPTQIKDSMLRISALFVNKCSKFKVYSEYSAAYLRFQQTITKHSAMREKLNDLNESGQQKEGVESLMIKPIQRVLKYPLFLEQMIQSCAEESVERRQASQALSRMQALASYVNEMQRLQEEYGALFEQIARANKRFLTANNISIDFSQLVMFAHLKWLNADDKKCADCVAFVFSTLILICPHKNKTKNCRIIPIRDIELNESEASSTSTLFVFVLIHLSPPDDTVYHLACCQAEIKTQFLKSVRKAAHSTRTAETARRPISGSSHSDGGYGSEKYDTEKKV